MASKCGVTITRATRLATLLEELRNFGREPKLWPKPATPAQEYEKKLAIRFATAKHRGSLSSSQIQELKAIWASNSGDKHPVVTMAQGSSEGGRGIKRQCEEDRNSGGQHSAVTKPVAHASSGDRPQAKRPCQEEHARMPPQQSENFWQVLANLEVVARQTLKNYFD